MAHLITPITLQGVAGYDDTYVDNQNGSGPLTWDYEDPFTVCCQTSGGSGHNPFTGVTPRLYQSSGHDEREDVRSIVGSESVYPAGPGNNGLSCRVLWAETDSDQLGVVCSGSIRFGICCASYAYMTMWGQMRSQAAYAGDDWVEVYVNGSLQWSHSSSNPEAQDYWDAEASDPTLANIDFNTYQYSEAITLELDPGLACGNIIEIRSSTESATISQSELDGSIGSIWHGVFWHGILTSLA